MKVIFNKMLLLGATSLVLASCMDDINIFGNNQQDGGLTFSATIDEQDWYAACPASRGAVQHTDEVIPTDFVTAAGKRISLTSHEVNGISGERIRLADKRQSRAIVSNAIDTRKLSISQVGYTQGDGKNEFVEIMNAPAVTTNGMEWSCNEFFVNRKDYTAVRMFGALFPYNEDYKVKVDDYENKKYAYGTLPWLYQFRTDYELASDSAHLQEDLLYAKQIRSFTADSYATEGPTPLTFRHAMTAVKVKLGSTGFVPAVIKEVRLKNVHNKGTLHFFDRYKGQTESQMVNTSGWWDVADSKTTCYSITEFDTQGEYNCYVTGDAATFMMIPQELPEDATLELDVVFNGDIDGTVVTISAPIGRHSADGLPKYWNIGTTHEYIIDTKENVNGYYMVIDGIDQNERTKYVSAKGGEANFKLKSYKRTSKVSDEYAPLQWQFVGWSLDGEEWTDENIDWIELRRNSDNSMIQPGMGGEGSITGEIIDVKIREMKAEDNVPHADILRNRRPKGNATDGAYDLSRHEYGTGKPIATTTANSYVIDAPGHYTFPTVYGNSMVNGKANPTAFGLEKGVGNSAPKPTSFVDYLDRQIVSPLIQYNTKLHHAALIWEDVKGLVTDVKLTQRGDYVDFRIDRNNIDQGNAVIAVYDAQNRIVWSWHIWVTDENVNATVATGSGNYKAMPVNLGWKSKSNANAVPGRDIYLLFAQGDSEDDMVNYQTIVRITQNGEYISDKAQNHKGSSPYYQWGRKDPMVGAYNGKSIPVYTYDGRSFYCESLTTWKVPEWLAIVNKTFIFTATMAAGIAVEVCSCGAGTVVVAGAIATLAGGAANVGLAAMDEKCFSTTDQWGTTIGYAIQNPTCDIKSAMTWTDCKNHAPYHDLWGIGQNVDNRSKKVVKTIYDPCPVGFHVPEGNAFYGVERKFNDGLANNTMYLPPCGVRIDYIHEQAMEGSFDIHLLQVGQACGYWTAAPSSEGKNKNQHDNESYRSSEGAYAIVSDKKMDGTTKGSYEAWGYNMRPIADY